MKKKILILALVMGLLLVSAVSAGIFDIFRARVKTAPELELKPTSEDLSKPITIPGEPELPTKEDAGAYGYGYTGPGLFGESETYQGVYGKSINNFGVAATTRYGMAAVWAAQVETGNSAKLATPDAAVYGLANAEDAYAGKFLGGKVYSEEGFSTRNYRGTEVTGATGTFSCDGKRVTVVNGLITSIE